MENTMKRRRRGAVLTARGEAMDRMRQLTLLPKGVFQRAIGRSQ
jgi:hypothetical protein